ncbi:hypothetical protein ACSBR1_013275 [Camellia fascicularis]
MMISGAARILVLLLVCFQVLVSVVVARDVVASVRHDEEEEKWWWNWTSLKNYSLHEETKKKEYLYKIY